MAKKKTAKNMIVMPSAVETERELLAQIIMDNDVIDKVTPYLPNHSVFYDNFHANIWKGIKEIRKNGDETIDLNTLMAEIPPSIGKNGVGYELTGITGLYIGSSNAVSNGKIVYEKWLLRRVIQSAEQVKQVAFVKNSRANDVLTKLHRELELVIDMQIGENFDLNESIDSAIQHMLDADNTIPFGIPQLDDLTGGMTKGEITVVAGRPGHFKTTTTINIVRNLLHAGHKVLVFNREMSNLEMLKKLIVMESETISYENVRLGVLTAEDMNEIDLAKDMMKDKYKNLIMFDNIFDLDGAMREVRKHKPDVIVDDYIGLISVGGIEDNRLRIDTIMKQYKWAAKKNDACVILVSQLNRECESRHNKRPLLRDLRDSGSIEQDAEMILFMFYEWRYFFEESDLGEYGIDMILGKNRYGKTGKVTLGVLGNRCKLYNDKNEALQEAYKS